MNRFSKCLSILLLGMPLLGNAAEMNNLRNQRYCEIILSEKKLNFAVYNTIGLNDCPENIWDKITIESIKKETGTKWAHLNGPRYWTIDGFKNTKAVNPEPRVLGGLSMREAGILHLGVMDLLGGNKPYQPKTVTRDTTWVFQANKPIYELISPNGEVYVMQSYSVQTHPQSANSLTELGDVLKLPPSWRFRSGVLKNQMELTALNHKATVIQDDFLNTYQLSQKDFLE